MVKAALPSPLAHGAVGDGVADDTAAVGAALAAGGTVGLLGQSYLIRQPLAVPAGTQLVGPGALIIDFDGYNQGTANTALHLLGDGIRLRDFALVKRFAEGSWAIGIGGENLHDLRLDHLEISGYSAGQGICLKQCQGVQVESLWIHNFSLNWLRNLTTRPVAGLMLLGCDDALVRNSRFDHLELGPEVRALAPSGTPQGYASAGIYLADCRGIVMLGNTFAVLGCGIMAVDSQNCVMNANALRDTWGAAISLLRSSFNCVLGNQISTCGQGIRVAGSDATAPLTAASAQTSNGNAIKANQLLDIGAAGYFGIAGNARVGVGAAGAIIQQKGHAYNLVDDHVLARGSADPNVLVSITADGATLNSQANDNLAVGEGVAPFEPAPLPPAAPNPPTTAISIKNQVRHWTLFE
jgi:hypothetical protein